MATGAKLPNSNLNLIKEGDVVDNADINAIAQAVESATISARTFAQTSSLPEGSVGAAPVGYRFINGSTTYTGLPSGITWGSLLTFGSTTSNAVQILIQMSKVYWRQWVGSSWKGWYELTGTSV